MILMEVICDKGSPIGRDSHVFPREPQSWINEVEHHGASLIEWFGQEFLFADRLFVRLAQSLFGRSNKFAKQLESAAYRPASRDSVAHRVYWQLRHITLLFSVWAEPVAMKLSPASLATHGVFVFRKER
jgi:hypothetical protein